MNKQTTSFSANTSNASNPSCNLCMTEKHSLFTCPQFKTLTQAQRMSSVKPKDLSLNCLHPEHFVKQCRSTHHCHKSQKFHHTLLHIDQEMKIYAPTQGVNLTANANPDTLPGALLITYRELSHGPDGSSIQARALLDSASSVSFVSEHLVQALRLK